MQIVCDKVPFHTILVYQKFHLVSVNNLTVVQQRTLVAFCGIYMNVK